MENKIELLENDETKDMIEVEELGLTFKIPNNFIIENDEIYICKKDGMERFSHLPIYITSIINNIDNRRRKIRIGSKEKWRMEERNF